MAYPERYKWSYKSRDPDLINFVKADTERRMLLEDLAFEIYEQTQAKKSTEEQKPNLLNPFGTEYKGIKFKDLRAKLKPTVRVQPPLSKDPDQYK